MQRIHIIRHGATLADKQNLYCGKSDLPLCPEGLDELHKLAVGGYPSVEGCRVVTDGTQRTEQTLEALYGKAEHEQMPDFREIDYGVFELQSYAQLKERADYQLWQSGNTARNRCPGGESGEDVANRVRPAFAGLLEDGRDTVLVISGGVMAAIMTDLFPDSMAGRLEWQSEPGHGWSVAFEGGKPVKCEPIPDPFLNQEKTLGTKWAWVSMAFLAGAVSGVLAAAYSAMEQTHRETLWFGVAAVLLVISQAIRFKKLRCPYCGKSVAPLKFIGSPKLACPRCGRIYHYEG